MVEGRSCRPRDPRQAHYTASAEIVSFMVSRLRPQASDLVWEPCAGSGDLIDGILQACPAARIVASEIDDTAVSGLRSKYSHCKTVHVEQEDVLDSAMLARPRGREPTAIIANPPYGAWQSYERRARLKARFPSLYVRETYSVFLAHCFESLANDGRLVFIIPDTFFWLHRHEELRRRLLADAVVDEVALFPSRFFPGISFGYSGLSILSLRKKRPSAMSTFTLLDRIKNPDVLARIAAGSEPGSLCSVMRIAQSEVLGRDAAELRRTTGPLLVSQSREIRTLGQIAEIKTGFYSGNDVRWVRRHDSSVPRAARYADVDPSAVRLSAGPPPLDGVPDSEPHFIPIVRGGSVSSLTIFHHGLLTKSDS